MRAILEECGATFQVRAILEEYSRNGPWTRRHFLFYWICRHTVSPPSLVQQERTQVVRVCHGVALFYLTEGQCLFVCLFVGWNKTRKTTCALLCFIIVHREVLCLKVELGIWEFCAIGRRLISKIRFPHPISVADAICGTRFDQRDSKRRALEN